MSTRLPHTPAITHAWETFLRCIAENQMEPLLSRGVLLALSGGADSVLLFHLLRVYTEEKNIPFAALHVHHGIRGEEADRDADFCADLCQKAGVLFFLRREDAPAYAAGEGHGRGLEYAARRVRYAAIEAVMAENPAYGVCATAHNATDNLETVLLHMLRGSGLRGMCGIPPVRGVFVRPLLLVSKRDVLAAITDIGAAYITDSTNNELTYDRNYLRAEVLPRLSHLREDPEAAVSRLTANMREENSVSETLCDRFMAKYVPGHVVPRQALLSLPSPVACRVLCRLAAPFLGDETPGRQHVHAFLALLAGNRVRGLYSMPGGFFGRFEQDAVWFEAKRDGMLQYSIPLAMGQNKLPENTGEIWLFDGQNTEFEKAHANVYNLSIQANVDSATIIGKLSARTLEEGDRYRTGGMTRRVRRLLSAAHMSEEVRHTLPIVCDEAGILWVPGFGVRDGAAAGGEDGLHIYYLAPQ